MYQVYQVMRYIHIIIIAVLSELFNKPLHHIADHDGVSYDFPSIVSFLHAGNESIICTSSTSKACISSLISPPLILISCSIDTPKAQGLIRHFLVYLGDHLVSRGGLHGGMCAYKTNPSLLPLHLHDRVCSACWTNHYPLTNKHYPHHVSLFNCR